MDLIQLNHFLVTAEIENMTKAAHSLYLSQPALSRTIRKLEDEFGVELFDRIGKHIKLNDYGKIVHHYVRRVFNELNDMRSELSDATEGKIGSATIGISYSMNSSVWQESVCRWFVMQHPKVKFGMYEMEPNELIEALIERRIDIAISSSAPIIPIVKWKRLYSTRIGILMSTKHPLAANDELSVIDLVDEQFVSNNSNSDNSRTTISICENSGFAPNIMFEMDQPELIGEMISMGMCVSFIDEDRYKYNKQYHPYNKPWEENITFRYLIGDYCERSCYVGTLSNRYENSALKALYDRIFAIVGKQP